MFESKIKNENKPSDEDLVRTALADPEAFGLIIDRYNEPLSRYIRRLTRSDEDEIKDILQDIFIKIYLNLNDFDHSLKFSSWIYRVAHNQVIDNWRKSQVRPSTAIDPDDVFWLTVADDLDLEADAHRRELGVKIRELIDKLDGDYRSILILRYLEDKDYREISDIMKKPIGTVATLINRAKKKLKNLVEEAVSIEQE
ncbi:MAG: RNA polymerase sigma factor [Candidatus Paceibacterota bacterium]|jgi:RNA polymerase sigma-70 factor (ECF subfamily)